MNAVNARPKYLLYIDRYAYPREDPPFGDPINEGIRQRFDTFHELLKKHHRVVASRNLDDVHQYAFESSPNAVNIVSALVTHVPYDDNTPAEQMYDKSIRILRKIRLCVPDLPIVACSGAKTPELRRALSGVVDFWVDKTNDIEEDVQKVIVFLKEKIATVSLSEPPGAQTSSTPTGPTP